MFLPSHNLYPDIHRVFLFVRDLDRNLWFFKIHDVDLSVHPTHALFCWQSRMQSFAVKTSLMSSMFAVVSNSTSGKYVHVSKINFVKRTDSSTWE